MLIIDGPASLTSIADPDVRSLVSLRMSQLGDGEPYDPQAHGELCVAEEGDTAEALEAATGVFVLSNPFDGSRYGDADWVSTAEVIEEHASCFELVFQLSDESAVAIFVPKDPGMDPELLALCHSCAVPSID